MTKTYDAYLHWQKERGLIYPAQRRVVLKQASQDLEKVYRIVFYDLTEHPIDESSTKELLGKMLQAIQVELEDVVVKKLDSLDAIDKNAQSVCAVFCENGIISDENDMIGVPHPAEILVNPILKRAAWESLKKIAMRLRLDHEKFS